MDSDKRFRNLLSNVILRAAKAALAIAMVIGLAAELSQSAPAQTPTTTYVWTQHVLYHFGSAPGDGMQPESTVIMDSAGNLYGTVTWGGLGGNGVVYEVSPNGSGGWTEQTLYHFCPNQTTCPDGAHPQGGLILDPSGNLYGTASYGGAGWGTVFELSPNGSGAWTEQTLYSFKGLPLGDAGFPTGSLIMDAAGNLYGTTVYGGAYSCHNEGGENGCGAVFKLSPNGSGGWTEEVLHCFGSTRLDGVAPVLGSLIMDAAGNLYGTTTLGGAYGKGLVYELMPEAGGRWKLNGLLAFDGSNGAKPEAGLLMDAAGNLYGTAENGGIGSGSGNGTIFEVSPEAGGGWKRKVLHYFNGTDGKFPMSQLLTDGAGNLYGTAEAGGTYNLGTVFELTPTTGGNWAERTLLTFRGRNGEDPYVGLMFDATGNLYGTTYFGGNYGFGVVFELTHN